MDTGQWSLCACESQVPPSPGGTPAGRLKERGTGCIHWHLLGVTKDGERGRRAAFFVGVEKTKLVASRGPQNLLSSKRRSPRAGGRRSAAH